MKIRVLDLVTVSPIKVLALIGTEGLFLVCVLSFLLFYTLVIEQYFLGEKSADQAFKN